MLEEQVFVYDSYVNKKFYTLCDTRFRHKYPVFESQLQQFLICWKKYINWVFLKKYTRQNPVLTKEMFQGTRARLEHLPCKSLAWVAQ
jgi:hypothetical protein